MAAAAGAGALGGIVGGAVTYGLNVAASNDAWRRQKRVLQNQIQWRVADLRAAGLNPILAAGSFLGGGAPSVVAARATDIGQAGAAGAASATKAYKSKAERELARSAGGQAKAGTKSLLTQADANTAQAALAYANADLARESRVTQLSIQRNNTEQANMASAGALERNANRRLLEERYPQIKIRSDIARHPVGKRVLQAQELMGPFISGRKTMTIPSNARR